MTALGRCHHGRLITLDGVQVGRCFRIGRRTAHEVVPTWSRRKAGEYVAHIGPARVARVARTGSRFRGLGWQWRITDPMIGGTTGQPRSGYAGTMADAQWAVDRAVNR